MITPFGIAGALQLTFTKNGVISLALTSRGAEGAKRVVSYKLRAETRNGL